jgi:hypothetical protein
LKLKTPGGKPLGVFFFIASVDMAVISFKRARRRRSIRYYLCTDEGPFRVPLHVFRGLVSGDARLPQLANSLQHVVEALIEADAKGGKRIKTRSTSTRFDAEGKIDLNQAAEIVGVLVEGSQPKRITDNILDIGPTIRARRSEHEAKWRASSSTLRLIRADVEGKKKLPFVRY